MPGQGRLFSEKSGITEITGKDEMNLAEYPICLLSRKPIPGIHTIEYREGNTSWRITGSAEYGLPLGGDQDVYVAIMETWKQNGFSSNRIEFGSVFQLLKRLGMPTSKQYYERFKQAVKRLAGLTIYAENSFYDHQGRRYDTIRGFHLFEDFRFSTRKSKHISTSEEPNGYIRASDVLWLSVKNGYIKNLNLAFYSRLSSPCVKRIYRFLDKKRFVSDRFRMGLINFAKKMGLMAGSTKCYPSHIKKDLTPAFRELQEIGFLRSFSYEKQGSGKEENVVCLFPENEMTDDSLMEESVLLMDILEFTGAAHSVPYYKKRIRELGNSALTTIHHALSCAKVAEREGAIRTSKDQYFIGVLKATCSESTKESTR